MGGWGGGGGDLVPTNIQLFTMKTFSTGRCDVTD